MPQFTSAAQCPVTVQLREMLYQCLLELESQPRASVKRIPICAVSIPGHPVPKGRPRFNRSGHAFTPKKTRDAEKQIGWALKAAMPGWAMDTLSEFGIRVIAYRERRGDADNFLKCVMDSCNEIVWGDDAQCTEVYCRAIWDANPRTEVTIYRIEA